MLSKSPDPLQRKSAAHCFYDIAKSMLTSKGTPFDEMHPFSQYSLVDEVLVVVRDYFGSNSLKHEELKELLKNAEPFPLQQYGGFSVVKNVPGPLSDRNLTEGRGGGLEGKVIVPSETDFPLAEMFREDNFGEKAALYLCQNPWKEFRRLKFHYSDVVLIRSL